MSTSAAIAVHTSRKAKSDAWGSGAKDTWWAQHREASLNWLALGLLLAAWNASDRDPMPSRRRPESLRGYAYVSVRAASHNFEQRGVVASSGVVASK